MYSPGSLNVAVVLALPVNVVFSGPLNSAASAVGLSAANFTEPGPRNLLHVSVTAGVRGRVAPGTLFASSATHKGSVNGLPVITLIAVLCPRGPFTHGPVALNPM